MRVLAGLVCSVALLSQASAVPVDPSAPDGVAALYVEKTNYTEYIVLCTDGQAYSFQNGSNSWAPYADTGPLPVPISEIADWVPSAITLHSGAHYFYRGNYGWHRIGGGVVPAVCPAPAAAESKSIGGIKSMYR